MLGAHDLPSSRARRGPLRGLGFRAFFSGRAAAGNDDQLPVGGEAAIFGNAVVATVSDGAAGYHNPAGLAQSERNQLDASITAVGFRFYSVPELLTSASGEKAGPTVAELVLVPTAATYTRRLSERVVASFGIFSPRTQFFIMQESLHLASPDLTIHEIMLNFGSALNF
jgi:hypothetical protein